MKKTLKVKDLVRVENAIVSCNAVKAVKFDIGMAHNLKVVKSPLTSVRESLKPTEAIEVFNRAMLAQREKNMARSQEEQIAAFAALREKHPQAMLDSEEMSRKDKEAGEMEFEVDLYRIPLTYVPGWFSSDMDDPEEIDKKNAAGTVPQPALNVFIEFDILYDPEIETQEGEKVAPATAPAPVTPIEKKAKSK